jgi:hypothetical protein
LAVSRKKHGRDEQSGREFYNILFFKDISGCLALWEWRYYEKKLVDKGSNSSDGLPPMHQKMCMNSAFSKYLGNIL